MRSFQLVRHDSKGPATKPLEPLSPLSFFRTHLSANAFRHQRSNQMSPVVQNASAAVGRLGFFGDETPEAILTHPTSYGSGFAPGVSSPLMSSALKFVFGMCFR
jgi:hypothetical protein